MNPFQASLLSTSTSRLQHGVRVLSSALSRTQGTLPALSGRPSSELAEEAVEFAAASPTARSPLFALHPQGIAEAPLLGYANHQLRVMQAQEHLVAQGVATVVGCKVVILL
jgi:hypothetical protein